MGCGFLLFLCFSFFLGFYFTFSEELSELSELSESDPPINASIYYSAFVLLAFFPLDSFKVGIILGISPSELGDSSTSIDFLTFLLFLAFYSRIFYFLSFFLSFLDNLAVFSSLLFFDFLRCFSLSTAYLNALPN